MALKLNARRGRKKEKCQVMSREKEPSAANISMPEKLKFNPFSENEMKYNIHPPKV